MEVRQYSLCRFKKEPVTRVNMYENSQHVSFKTSASLAVFFHPSHVPGAFLYQKPGAIYLYFKVQKEGCVFLMKLSTTATLGTRKVSVMERYQ